MTLTCFAGVCCCFSPKNNFCKMWLLNNTQTYLLEVTNVCTFQLLDMSTELYSLTHKMKWDLVEGDPFNTPLHQIACRKKGL